MIVAAPTTSPSTTPTTSPITSPSNSPTVSPSTSWNYFKYVTIEDDICGHVFVVKSIKIYGTVLIVDVLFAREQHFVTIYRGSVMLKIMTRFGFKIP
jgi:hypothetical protein